MTVTSEAPTAIDKEIAVLRADRDQLLAGVEDVKARAKAMTRRITELEKQRAIQVLQDQIDRIKK